MTDTTELGPCATDLASCYVFDGATLTVYYDGRPWTYDVQENATLVRVEIPSASAPCDGYAAICTPSMLFDYAAPTANPSAWMRSTSRRPARSCTCSTNGRGIPRAASRPRS